MRRVSTMTIRVYVPLALRAAASVKGNAARKKKLLDAAKLCEHEPTPENARKAREIAKGAYAAAYAAANAYAAYAAANADAAYAAANAAYAAYADAAYAAYAAANAAYAAYAAANAAADANPAAAAYAACAASRDSVLASFCEQIVGILIEMKAPGCQWLGLTVN
jgi:hypothetical protein